MNKRLFAVLLVLMSLSLLGIIFVQVYWINSSYRDKEEQFSHMVGEALDKVVVRIEEREMHDYFGRLAAEIDSAETPISKKLSNILFIQRDQDTDQILFYQHGILEERYDVNRSLFDTTPGLDDSSTVTNIVSQRTKAIFKESPVLDGSGGVQLTPVERLEKLGGLSSIEKAQYEDVFMENAKTIPIHLRVSKQEIQFQLNNELTHMGIDLNYEYGIESDGYPTPVKSKDFKFGSEVKYKVPIFRDSEGKTPFSLMLTFPGKKKFILSRILGMVILSLVFTLVILVAYAGAIYQLLRQKKLSEIKSDFINNMTHEFKTPIATINLAVASLSNPAFLEDKEKLQRYLGMIHDENKRMLAQVENVLRISKLEKNQLDIEKDRIDVHELILQAVGSMDLIVQNREGYIHTHLEAERCEILANEMHFKNVITNVLDNAVKYSPERPEIDVYTENGRNHILIKVQDKGAGMSKAVLKKVFEKFYREQTGNIHNVKGHGLGLAYVKKVVEDHQGEVYAESEKGKGSTFYIKLPVI